MLQSPPGDSLSWRFVVTFSLSNCVGLVTPDPGEAARFYQSRFGMRVSESDLYLELEAGPLELFIDPGRPRDLVLELVTDDLVAARTRAREFGFEELVWRGVGQSCLVQDPFGIVFNIHEDRLGIRPVDVPKNESTCPIRASIGLIVPSPHEAAEFYASVFDLSYSQAIDHSYFLDPGAIRMRIEQGEDPTAFLMLERMPTSDLEFVQREIESSGKSVDPFGIRWRLPDEQPGILSMVSCYARSKMAE